MSSIPQTREQRAAGVRKWAADALTKGLSYVEVGRALGVSKGAIQNLVGGSVPQEDTLVRMEKAMVRIEHKAAMDAGQVQDGSELERHLEAITARAGGDPIWWAVQVEALAAAYRGLALARAEGAAEARADNAARAQSEGRGYKAAAVKRRPRPGNGDAKKRAGGEG